MILTIGDSDSATIFVLIGIAAAAVITIGTFIEVLKTPADAKFQSGTKSTWVVVILLTGIIGALIYHAAGRPPHHDVLIDPTTSQYWCKDCNFVTDNASLAREHRLKAAITPDAASTAASRSVKANAEVPKPPAPVATAPPAATLKVCPDCAEEVRFAARKCRFCGYMFESADVPR